MYDTLRKKVEEELYNENSGLYDGTGNRSRNRGNRQSIRK